MFGVLMVVFFWFVVSFSFVFVYVESVCVLVVCYIEVLCMLFVKVICF